MQDYAFGFLLVKSERGRKYDELGENLAVIALLQLNEDYL